LGIVGLTGQVLSMGLASVLFLPCSVAAWAVGHREMQKSQALGLPESSLRSARAGYVLGILGVLLAVLVAAGVVLFVILVAAAAGHDAQHVKLLTDW
jgi:hypothetical protein